VAGDELGLVDQVRRADRLGAKAQVRDGDRAGFLRVVHEVALGVVVGLFTDDLDRVLVRADGAVCAQPKNTHARSRGSRISKGIVIQAGEGNIIVDADGEVVLGLAFDISSKTP
jgi:hypothetical protein